MKVTIELWVDKKKDETRTLSFYTSSLKTRKGTTAFFDSDGELQVFPFSAIQGIDIEEDDDEVQTSGF